MQFCVHIELSFKWWLVIFPSAGNVIAKNKQEKSNEHFKNLVSDILMVMAILCLPELLIHNIIGCFYYLLGYWDKGYQCKLSESCLKKHTVICVLFSSLVFDFYKIECHYDLNSGAAAKAISFVIVFVY